MVSWRCFKLLCWDFIFFWYNNFRNCTRLANKKANNISEQLLKKDLLETTDFIQLENKFEASFKHNNNTKIIWVTHHKLDYGANILIEPYGNNVKELNGYLIKLYFTNSSDKNHIKKIELESFMCVQDSDECRLLESINISMNPMIAGLAMTLSSFTVIINALRLKRWKER